MKQIVVWLLYGIGALSIGYLALRAYAILAGHDAEPHDPIHIFRRSDTPEYS